MSASPGSEEERALYSYLDCGVPPGESHDWSKHPKDEDAETPEPQQAYLLECNCGVDDGYERAHFCENCVGPAAIADGHDPENDVSTAWAPLDEDVSCEVCGVPLVGATEDGATEDG